MADRRMGRRSRIEALADGQLAQPAAVAAPLLPGLHEPRYQLTGWAPYNSLLAVVDRLSGGRSALLQHLFTYLFIGGCAALVNLAVYGVLANIEHTPFLVAQLVAAEISIMANFIPNDRITFSRLPGHQRSWPTRCLRFNLTAVGGTIVTIIASLTFQQLGFAKLVAQACAILIALVFNFTFHHLFTYGGYGRAEIPPPAPVSMFAWARMRPPIED